MTKKSKQVLEVIREIHSSDNTAHEDFIIICIAHWHALQVVIVMEGRNLRSRQKRPEFSYLEPFLDFGSNFKAFKRSQT